jgi:O-antigen/teichoic acid export membrane protein
MSSPPGGSDPEHPEEKAPVAIDAESELKRGLLWFGSATLLMRLLDLVGLFILLRKLSREDMGIASLAWSVAIVVEALSGLGVGSALIQAKDVSRRELDSLFWFSTLVGCVLSAAMALAAPLVAGFYREPALTGMLVVAASKLVFVGIAMVPLQVLARNLRFREASAVQTGASALEAATKVVLLLCNAGAWSLVVANAARGVYALLFVYLLAPFWPKAHLRFAEVRRFLAFGIRNTVSTAIFFAHKNTDYLFVGRFLGVEALGVYRVAFDIAMTPLEIVINIVNRVAFPVYSRIAHDPKALEAALARSFRYLFLLLGPSIVFLSFATGDTVRIIAHERWLAAVPIAQLLCWAALLRGFAELYPQIFYAVNRGEYAVYDALMSLLVLAGGLGVALHFFGQRWGLLAVGAVWILTYPVVLVVLAYWTRRVADIRPWPVLKPVLPVLGALVTMAVALALLSSAFFYSAPLYAIGPAGRFTLYAGVGLGAYGLHLRWVLGVRFRDLSVRRA